VEALNRLVAQQPIEYPAGTRCSYNQTGYRLLGRVVERVSGQPYAEFVQTRLLRPSGITGARFTSYSSPARNSFSTPVIPHLAPSYLLTEGELRRSVFLHPTWDQPTSGLLLTIQDLLRWDQALRSGKLLPPSTLEQAWTPARLKDGTPAPMWWGHCGLGWLVAEHQGHRYVGHLGGNSVWYGRYPAEDLTVIVLTNLDNSNPAALAERVADFYLPPPKDPPK
jgi:CubicO group peptidase (beta-lactamase class C family)